MPCNNGAPSRRRADPHSRRAPPNRVRKRRSVANLLQGPTSSKGPRRGGRRPGAREGDSSQCQLLKLSPPEPPRLPRLPNTAESETTRTPKCTMPPQSRGSEPCVRSPAGGRRVESASQSSDLVTTPSLAWPVPGDVWATPIRAFGPSVELPESWPPERTLATHVPMSARTRRRAGATFRLRREPLARPPDAKCPRSRPTSYRRPSGAGRGPRPRAGRGNPATRATSEGATTRQHIHTHTQPTRQRHQVSPIHTHTHTLKHRS